jgi:alpha/beta superfamily hydrolase
VPHNGQFIVILEKAPALLIYFIKSYSLVYLFLDPLMITRAIVSFERDDDPQVLQLNENALKEIKAEKKKVTVIPGATHLFEEPRKLEQVARIASGRFRCYFLIKKHSQTES